MRLVSVGWLSALWLLTAYSAEISPECQQVTVVECFIKFLSSWAWELWRIRENIAALNATSCAIHGQIRGCLNIDGCNLQDAVEISKVVTDLLHHKKDAGTFLRSVFAMEYACTNPGLQVIQENHACLKQHHIGNELLDRVKEFGKDFEEMSINGDFSQACEKLTSKAHEVRDSAKAGCDGNELAGKLICHSVAAPFRKLNELRFENCFPCKTEENEAEDPPEPERTGQPANTAIAESQNGKTGGASRPVSLLFPIALISLIVASFP